MHCCHLTDVHVLVFDEGLASLDPPVAYTGESSGLHEILWIADPMGHDRGEDRDDRRTETAVRSGRDRGLWEVVVIDVFSHEAYL